MPNPYTPRTTPEILREIVARIVARTALTDVSEGSELHLILYAIAQEMAALEIRSARIRDSFFLDGAVGQLLDDRVADLPPSGIVRRAASSASGGSLTLVRQDTDGDLVVPAGSTYGRTDDATIIYRQISDATFLDGTDSVTEVAVIALVPGRAGNVSSGGIDRVLSAPSGVTGANNRAALSNGQDAEGDESLAQTARAYLSSLTGTTPSALEFVGRDFTSTAGARAAFVRIFEDYATPAYAELLVDDGSALSGYTREGAVATGTVPTGGPPILWHESPAVDPITTIQIVSSGQARELAPGEFTSFPERGVVYVHGSVLSAGDTWTIQKYNVWVGLPAELQRVIEGDLQDPLNDPGYRATGIRVRVVAPLVATVDLSVNVVPFPGLDVESVSDAVRDAIVQYVATLGPGEPLYMARLIARIMANKDLLTVRFFSSDDDTVCAEDILPPSPRHVLRTEAARISVIPLPQEI